MNQPAGHAKAAPDLAAIGAGIFGLWAARHALKRGERVVVLEKRRVGAGASGGFLGALMPHMPDRWNAKKQLQYDGLVSLPGAIAALEADTGHDCGYRRCGRLMPLRHERMIGHLGERIEGARLHWADGKGAADFTMELVAPEVLANTFSGPDGRPWLSPAMARFGAQHDTLSARLNPRACLAALAAYVRGHPNGDVVEGAEVRTVEADGCGVSIGLGDGTGVTAGRALIANGWEAYALIPAMNQGAGLRLGGRPVTGRGVKGQAVLFDLPHDDTMPIVYDSGSYVVPHGAAMGADERGRPNRVAVGSTSLDDWHSEGSDPEALRTDFDPLDTGFADHARALVPALNAATLAERWANIRPRNTMPDAVTGKIGAEPVFGPVDGQARIMLATGGFKISFALAHLDLMPH